MENFWSSILEDKILNQITQSKNKIIINHLEFFNYFMFLKFTNEKTHFRLKIV